MFSVRFWLWITCCLVGCIWCHNGSAFGAVIRWWMFSVQQSRQGWLVVVLNFSRTCSGICQQCSGQCWCCLSGGRSRPEQPCPAFQAGLVCSCFLVCFRAEHFRPGQVLVSGGWSAGQVSEQWSGQHSCSVFRLSRQS